MDGVGGDLLKEFGGKFVAHGFDDNLGRNNNIAGKPPDVKPDKEAASPRDFRLMVGQIFGNVFLCDHDPVLAWFGRLKVRGK